MNRDYPYFPGGRPAWPFHLIKPAAKAESSELKALRADLAKVYAAAASALASEFSRKKSLGRARRLEARIAEHEKGPAR